MKIAILVGILAVVAFSPTFSAASETAKHSQKASAVKHRQVKANNPYKNLEPYRSMGFIGTYPGEYARLKASGECVIDLGYGRWESCNVGGAM
jgi:hypothetical protein